jgi:hypothetical protein
MIIRLVVAHPCAPADDGLRRPLLKSRFCLVPIALALSG